MQIKIEIKNIDKIQSHFARMPIEITKGLHKAVVKSSFLIQAEAMKEAPVNKQANGGNLRQSISANTLGIAKAAVVVGASYGLVVHEGSRPHEIRIKTKKVLADRRSGRIFGKVVKHPGTKANPFLQRAVDNKRDEVNDEFAAIIRDIIEI
jgi:HK97 gp10 family phage protein